MKPYLVHYTYRDRELMARVVGDSEREAEARFRNSHPGVGDVKVTAAPSRSPILPRGGHAPATVRFVRPVSDEEHARIAAEARRLSAALRERLLGPAKANSTRP